MVSIGGDRATSSDYKRANKEAVRRSQKSSKPRAEKREPERKQRVLGQQRLWNDTPSRAPARSAPAQKQQRPARKPIEPFPGYHWEPPKGATEPFGPTRNEPRSPSKIGEPGGGLFTPNTQGPNAAAVPEQLSLSRQAEMDKLGIAQAAGRDPKELGLKPEDVVTGRQPGVSPSTPNPQAPAAAPGTVGFPGVEVPPISDGVREILNDRNWKLPKKGKTVALSKSAYEKGSFEDLEQHDYRLSLSEWDRIEQTYSSEEARAAGYIPPAASQKEVDKNTPLMHMQDEETASLNWKTYEEMTDDQKAAIDFNTVLLESTQEDLEKKVKLAGDKRTKYDETVKKLFGEGGGSDVVAVNTVNLLSELDMDVVGQDLDEYLSGERAFDDKEIGDFKFSSRDVQTLESLATGGEQTPEQTSQIYAQVRNPENMAAVDSAGVEQVQKMIETKLQDPTADTYDFESLMFGKAKDTQAPPSAFSDVSKSWDKEKVAEFDDWAQWAWGEISAEKPQFTMEQMLGDLDATTRGSTEARQTWLNFIQSRVDMAGQYGSPEETAAAKRIAKYAGLEG